MKSSLTIPIAIVVGGIIIAGAVYVSQPKVPKMSVGNSSLVRPVSASDHILGNPVAPVMIVECSDFDCEDCKIFHETLNQIIATEGAGGKVAWVFREFPLIEINPNALSHARAAECVAQVAGNDTFWKFANVLFENQPAEPKSYGTFAQAAGISGDAFATCYADAESTVNARITADRQNALAVGAQRAPYSLIIATGKPPVVMDGAYPYDTVKQLIDEALSNSN